MKKYAGRVEASSKEGLEELNIKTISKSYNGIVSAHYYGSIPRTGRGPYKSVVIDVLTDTKKDREKILSHFDTHFGTLGVDHTITEFS